MKEVLNVGVIGLGNRGSNLLENCILPSRASCAGRVRQL